MTMCFILPRFSKGAQGGYKMVYEYANRLTIKGHKVKIVYLNDNVMERFAVPTILKKMYANFITHNGPGWFDLNNKIENISNLESDFSSKIKDVDIAVATAIETVSFLKTQFPQTEKAYFIQDFENWNFPEEDVFNSYREGFRNIVISSWLKGIVDLHAQRPAALISNPVDIASYKIVTPLKDRSKHSVALLYHEKPHKGFKYAYEAILKLREIYPDLSVEIFGVYERPHFFPSYIKYTKSASQQQTIEIYNKSAVFLCATVAEGYGLTGLEAMACGAALVSTDYQGVHEYAVDNVNALLSPVKDVDALVANVSRLFDDDELRYRIARAGVESVQKNFNWDIAVDKFEKVLTDQ